MENNWGGKMNFTLNVDRSVDLASGINLQMERNIAQAERLGSEAYNNRQRMLQAMEETASNTSESNMHLQKINAQLIKHIELLEVQLYVQTQQLNTLKNLFASTEDGVLVEKEMLKLLREIDDSHPLWEYVKDKGGDIAVAGILEHWPVIWATLKAILTVGGAIQL